MPPKLDDDDETTTTVSAINIKLPKLSNADPEDWFVVIESIFRRHKITSELTMFDYAIQNMDWNQLKFVRDLLHTNPLPVDAYTQLKSKYISIVSISYFERAEKLKHLPPLGDRRPYELFLEIQQLVKSDINSDFRAQEVFLCRMPPDIQPTLRNMLIEGQKLENVAKRADTLVSTLKSVSTVEQSASANSGPLDAIKELTNEVKLLKSEVNAIKQQNRNSQNYRNKNQYRNTNASSESNKNVNINTGWCFFHQKFKEKAFKCKEGCKYPN